MVGSKACLPAGPEIRAAPQTGRLYIQPPEKAATRAPSVWATAGPPLLSLCDSSGRNREPSGTVGVGSFCLHNPLALTTWVYMSLAWGRE